MGEVTSAPGELRDFDVRPSGLTVDPGNAVFVDVRVSPDQLIWRKPPTTQHR